MLGAIIGDIAGSRFEWHNIKTKEFELFTPECGPTDDSVMTLAIGRAILDAGGDLSILGECAVRGMRSVGRRYPDCGYGGHFYHWILSRRPMPPYNSYGNGAAMRISPCADAARTLEEALAMARAVTEVTHNHPEGVKGAEAATAAAFLAKTGHDKDAIREHIRQNYYPLDFTLDQIRPAYTFDVSCQGSVPQAIEAFLESTDFEDAIRNAVSIGGDSDTLAAIAGGIAECFYGVPDALRERALPYLDAYQRALLDAFEAAYPG